MSDAHAAKKPKTTSTTGPPLYSELDLAQLTVDATLLGSNETRFATVKYRETRLVYQLAGVGEAMRVPFGIDDGSKFGSKASMKLELSDAQLAFVRTVPAGMDGTAPSSLSTARGRLAGALPWPSSSLLRGCGTDAARFAAACPSGDRAMHSAASSAVAKLPRLTCWPPRHTRAR